MGTDWTDTVHTYGRFQGDIKLLETDLRKRLRGDVRFDGGSRAIYSTDASNYRQVPLGVVLPRDVDDLEEAVAMCRRHGAPITHRGAGTSLAGQTANAAVVIDSSKHLDRVLEVDPERRIARVQPGVRHDQLSDFTEAKYRLTFGPDTATHEYATFGGMIGNNSCGIHSEMAGCTAENVQELEILTYDGLRMRVGPTADDEIESLIQAGGRRGEIYARIRDLRDRYSDLIRDRYPKIPRRISGYNLDQLLPENGFHVARALVGSEGTLVTVLEATVRLVYSPPKRALVVLGYRDIIEAAEHIPDVKSFGPIGLEGFDDKLVQYMRAKNVHTRSLQLLTEGDGWLLVEFGGDTQEEATERARSLMENLSGGPEPPSMHLYENREDQHMLWQAREAGLGATARVPNEGDTWEGWEDSAVPPEVFGAYLKELRRLYHKYGYDGAFYGHFGHGVVHTRINFDLVTKTGIEKYRRFIEEASDLCLRFGGSLSGEHGDGQSRAEMLPKMYGEELVEAFREFKRIWDPQWKMNPGKVVDPYRIDENLRLGVDYDPPELETFFRFPDDDSSFHRAALRCVGVGKCRRHEMEAPEDVMCPSFLVTHEERHSTRGRARLLFEMLNGEETPSAWDNEDVHEALDLCLSCKGCKTGCPVNVDMATYKAEFLAHYHERKLRPRSGYAFGLIFWWARLASHAPRFANFITQTPGLNAVAKWIAGARQQRQLPPFATETFRDWFERRGARPSAGPRVMLWPDTFNNFFTPDTAKAAVEVLEGAGCRVVIPRRVLCCGRPLYDYGMLRLARKMWLDILETLRDEIRAGTPLVGLEPSCVAAFRDELINLFPNDADALRLSKQTFTLSEFLQEHLDTFAAPSFARKALVHGHCHHKSIMGMSADRALMNQIGLDFEIVKSSCCGMAGSFGFEAQHYDVSIACGELALLPAVREAAPDTLIIADGFSCREQIRQATNHHAIHTAELLRLAGR